MYPFTPSRRVSYIALSAVVIAAIAILYRRLAGNDPIALALGVVAVLLGIVAVTLLYGEWWQQYRRVLSGSVRYRRLGRRGRIIGIVGAILVFGYFAWLGAAIAIFGASPQHILLLQIWLVLFLIGSAFLFFPVVVRWGITLGLIRSGDDK